MTDFKVISPEKGHIESKFNTSYTAIKGVSCVSKSCSVQLSILNEIFAIIRDFCRLNVSIKAVSGVNKAAFSNECTEIGERF